MRAASPYYHQSAGHVLQKHTKPGKKSAQVCQTVATAPPTMVPASVLQNLLGSQSLEHVQSMALPQTEEEVEDKRTAAQRFAMLDVERLEAEGRRVLYKEVSADIPRLTGEANALMATSRKAWTLMSRCCTMERDMRLLETQEEDIAYRRLRLRCYCVVLGAAAGKARELVVEAEEDEAGGRCSIEASESKARKDVVKRIFAALQQNRSSPTKTATTAHHPRNIQAAAFANAAKRFHEVNDSLQHPSAMSSTMRRQSLTVAAMPSHSQAHSRKVSEILAMRVPIHPHASAPSPSQIKSRKASSTASVGSHSQVRVSTHLSALGASGGPFGEGLPMPHVETAEDAFIHYYHRVRVFQENEGTRQKNMLASSPTAKQGPELNDKERSILGVCSEASEALRSHDATRAAELFEQLSVVVQSPENLSEAVQAVIHNNIACHHRLNGDLIEAANSLHKAVSCEAETTEGCSLRTMLNICAVLTQLDDGVNAVAFARNALTTLYHNVLQYTEQLVSGDKPVHLRHADYKILLSNVVNCFHNLALAQAIDSTERAECEVTYRCAIHLSQVFFGERHPTTAAVVRSSAVVCAAAFTPPL